MVDEGYCNTCKFCVQDSARKTVVTRKSGQCYWMHPPKKIQQVFNNWCGQYKKGEQRSSDNKDLLLTEKTGV